MSIQHTSEMKTSIRNKLELVRDRFEELSKLLSKLLFAIGNSQDSLIAECEKDIESLSSFYPQNHKINKIVEYTKIKNKSEIRTDSKEFVKYHYTLSDRTDSEFWRYWNNQQNIEEYNDYLNMFLSKKRYCKKGETIFNHFNLASMLIGYEKPYLNKTKNMKYVDWTEPDYDIDYSNNITHDDYIGPLTSPFFLIICNPM